MCMEGGRGTSQGRPGSVLGPGSALNSLQNYPELLSGYKEISKEKPELAIYDPIIRILENSVNNIQPAKVKFPLFGEKLLKCCCYTGLLRFRGREGKLQGVRLPLPVQLRQPQRVGRVRAAVREEYPVRPGGQTVCRGCVLHCSGFWVVIWTVQVWLGVWASLCLLSTGFTLATFLLEPGRWQYPEKCVIFISLAYSLQVSAN